VTEKSVGPLSLPSVDTLSIQTSRSVVRAVEWSALVYQTGTLIWSVSNDPYAPVGKVILALLIPAHVALLPAYLRGRGPFSRGGLWVLAGVLASFAIIGLSAAACRPGTYGNPWFFMVNYSAATFGLLACYPWSGWSQHRRIAVELAIFAAFFAYLLALCALNNGSVGWTQVRSLAATMLWPLLGYVLGKGIRQVAIVATARQLEVQRTNFTDFYHFLHSDVKASIAAVRHDLPASDVRTVERLRQLDAAVSEYRVRLVLGKDQVPVADLFSERIKVFAGTVRITESPQVGGLTLPRPVGLLVGRALGDLLTNAVVHGGTAVGIGFDYDDHGVALRIDDDGPRFPDSVLEDESTSLHRLRQAARDLGGDLTKAAATLGGSSMRLTVPLARRHAGQ
jgi:hypothetical protein